MDLDKNFAKLLEGLHEKFECLKTMGPSTTPPPRASTPMSGVYLFSERCADQSLCHLYVGRSNRIAARYRMHCGEAAQYTHASFAWKLMAEAVGHKVTGRKGEGRADAIQRDGYVQAFIDAKKRIRGMEFRFVEETDQRRQALLEAYASIALNTPYNDFNTH